MNYGTRVDLVQGDGWTSESHQTHTVRYFNGRRFITVENRNFMTALSAKHMLFWEHFTRYVALERSPMSAHHKVSYFSRSVQTSGPSVMSRTMAALVPSDDQSVPF